jgi:hypothetical protein
MAWCRYCNQEREVMASPRQCRECKEIRRRHPLGARPGVRQAPLPASPHYTRCPRCSGLLLELGDREIGCLACGWRQW